MYLHVSTDSVIVSEIYSSSDRLDHELIDRTKNEL